MTNDKMASAAKIGPEGGPLPPDGSLGHLIAGTRRVRLLARLAGLMLAAAGAAFGGQLWLKGGLLGWLVVEINLDLLILTLIRAPQWRGKTLRPTLLRFYLLFGATALACFLAVGQHEYLGIQPLAFLLGLLTFFVGLVLGLLSFVAKKPERPA